jgi:uncharacterized protein (TIGR02996 family)
MIQTLLSAIRSDPDDEARWLALAQHLDDDGDYGLAILMRTHWPVCRDFVRDGDTVEQVVERMRKISLADLARLVARAGAADEGRQTSQGPD